MPFTALAADYMLDQLGANKLLYMSAHSAYSATGANELSGGTYARVAVTWSAASGFVKSLSGTPYNINAPASSSVAWIGFWDALTGGNFQGMWPNASGASAFAFAVPSSTGVFLAPGSGYAAGQQLVAFATGGSALPSGVTAGTIYYVISPTTDTFQLSATSGGSALSITSDGSGYVQAIVTESFSSAGVFSVASTSVTQA